MLPLLARELYTLLGKNGWEFQYACIIFKIQEILILEFLCREEGE